MKRTGKAPYNIDLLSKKTVKKSYGAGLIIVGNYIEPLKREIALLFPQPFDMEVSNVNYVLRKDVMVKEVENHGY